VKELFKPASFNKKTLISENIQKAIILAKHNIPNYFVEPNLFLAILSFSLKPCRDSTTLARQFLRKQKAKNYQE